jgi:uncharacterized protein with von Willebrand factor type A (vWA) domain
MEGLSARAALLCFSACAPQLSADYKAIFVGDAAMSP